MIVPIARYYNPRLAIEMAGTRVEFRDGRGLQMGFRIARTMTATPDTAEVSIVGLDPVRAKKMGAIYAALGEATLTVEAGYGRAMAQLFRGAVREFRSKERSGSDLVTRATADDGGDAVSEVPIRVSNVGMTAAQMINVAATAMQLDQHPSVAAVLGQADPSKQGPYTAVMTAKARDLLDAACRRIRCRWWVRFDQLHLGFRGQPDRSRPAVVISDDVLISGPSTDGSGLVALSMLLDPNTVPGSQVVQGGRQLRVESVIYSGETRGKILSSALTGRTL